MFVYDEISNEKFAESTASYFNNGANYFFAQFAVDEQEYSDSFMIYTIFANQFRNKPFVVLATRLGGDKTEYSSLTPMIPPANWYEREINDLFGLKAIGHPNLSSLVLHECFSENYHPLRKNFNKINSKENIQNSRQLKREYFIRRPSKEGEFEVPVGPIHAGIIEPGHFRFTQHGENMLNLETKLFFTHRGIEKATEGMDFSRALINAERICGSCTVSHAIAFSQAVENLAKIKISYRANLLRMFLAEMERLYNHIGDIGNLCAGLGWAVGVSQGARLKEQIMTLNEVLTGNRFLRGMIVPGGVQFDFTVAEVSMAIEKLDRVYVEMQDLMEMIRFNDAFLNRTNTTGVLSAELAYSMCATGITAKASGIARDMRKDQPYALYKDFDFKIPTYKTGDVTARLFIRYEEITQSMRLLHKIADDMPEETESLCKSIPPVAPYKMSIGWSESARGGNLHVVVSGQNNTVYRYFVRSASYANWPCVPHTMYGNIIADFPLINKSFELCYACLDR